MRANLAWILCFALGFAFADFGPLAPSALAQRPQNDADEGNREERAQRWRRWREERENGEGRGDQQRDRGERRRRWREERERDNEGSNVGEQRRGGSEENSDDDDDDDDENRDRSRGGEGRERGRGGRMDYNEYARNLVREHDKNSNMILDGDEVGQLRGPAASADANGDKSITVEEIVARLSSRESSAGRGRDRRSGESESDGETKTTASTDTKNKRVYTWLGNGPAGKENADKRKSFRFTPASERWGSAPSRITSRDRNEDGQVSMSEYTRTWSARTVREFQRYDSGGDGVITPKEVAE